MAKTRGSQKSVGDPVLSSASDDKENNNGDDNNMEEDDFRVNQSDESDLDFEEVQNPKLKFGNPAMNAALIEGAEQNLENVQFNGEMLKFAVKKYNEHSNKEIAKILSNIVDTQCAVQQSLKDILHVLKPVAVYLPIMIEKNEKTARKSHKVKDEEPWKINHVIIMRNEERLLKEFQRTEITEMVVQMQNTKWIVPKIGDLSLKQPIQEVLQPFFSLLDQPRFFGWAIAQFVRPPNYFGDNFLPQYHVKNDPSRGRDATQSARPNINSIEAALIASIWLFCGGRLIAEYPTSDTSTRPKNKRVQFLNACRDGVNQSGLHGKEKQNWTLHMKHAKNDFVPILLRPEYAEKMEQQAELQNRAKEEKKKRVQQMMAMPASNFLSTTPRSTVPPSLKRKNDIASDAGKCKLNRLNQYPHFTVGLPSKTGEANILVKEPYNKNHLHTPILPVTLPSEQQSTSAASTQIINDGTHTPEVNVDKEHNQGDEETEFA